MRFANNSLLCVAGLTLLLHENIDAQPAKDPDKGWVDYALEDLTEKERLKERPGNFGVLAGIADFFDGMYRIRPDLSCSVFPLYEGRTVWMSSEELTRAMDRYAKEHDGRARNKLRQYNFNIRSLIIHDAAAVEKNPALLDKLGKSAVKTFADVRKRHPGRAVLVIVDVALASLESDKQEEGNSALYLVPVKGQWRVAWYEKG